MEEKRISLVDKITMERKDWVKLKDEHLNWMTDGPQCQWEYFVDQLSNELIMRRY